MPIVNQELIGDHVDLPRISLPTGQFLVKTIRANLKQRNDQTWMVRTFLSPPCLSHTFVSNSTALETLQTDVSTGKSMLYSQLLENIDRVAAALKRRGLKAGDTFLIMASNHIELPVVFFAVWVAGGTNACLTFNLLSSDIRVRAVETNAKFVLTDEQRAAKVVQAVGDVVQEIFVIGQFEGCTPVTQLFEGGEEQDQKSAESGEQAPAADSLAWLMYSSGTTGIPKAIMHTHETVNKMIMFYKGRFFAGQKFLFINNMINSGGMSVNIATTVSHAQIHTMSAFSDDGFLAAIDQYKVHATHLKCKEILLFIFCYPDSVGVFIYVSHW